MRPIRLSRVILGGLVAGAIINVGEGQLNLIVLATEWEVVSRSLNRQPIFATWQIVTMLLVNWGVGIAAVWLYAAIRPRFGDGVRTAVCAGIVTWFPANGLGTAPMIVNDWISVRMWIVTLAWGLVEFVLATVAGAKLYKET